MDFFNLNKKDYKVIFQAFIIIIIFFIFIFIFIVMMSYVNTIRKSDRKEIYEIFIDELEIGDIISVSYDNMFSPFTQGFSRLRYIHPVIVCKKENERYVLELMDYGFDPNKKREKGSCNLKEEGCKSEVHMIPITRWFQINRNNYFQCHKLQKKNMGEIDREKINDMIWEYYENNKDLKLASISRYLNPFKDSIMKEKNIHNRFFCYETVGEILYNLEMMEEEEIGKNFDDVKMKDYSFKSFKIGMKTIRNFAF